MVGWRLQDLRISRLNSSERVLKKRIKLRESNERLNFSYQFFIYSSFEKVIFKKNSVVLNFSYSTFIGNILMPTAKYDTYKVI